MQALKMALDKLKKDKLGEYEKFIGLVGKNEELLKKLEQEAQTKDGITSDTFMKGQNAIFDLTIGLTDISGGLKYLNEDGPEKIISARLAEDFKNLRSKVCKELVEKEVIALDDFLFND